MGVILHDLDVPAKRQPIFAAQWLVVAATLWAWFSRLYHIAALPPQAWVDEVWIALHARNLLQTGQFFVYYPTFWGGMHPLMVDLTAVVQGLGFHSLISPRAVSVVGGVLMVPLAFACFDELWRGEWPRARRQITAALAAIVLSNLLFMVVISRVGYEPALVPVPLLFCIWQMRRAERTRRWANWFAAGIVLGLAQYLSHHARFFLPLLALFALDGVLRSSREHRRALVAGLLLFVAVAFVVAMPLAIFFLNNPRWLLFRAQSVGAGSMPTGLPSLLLNANQILLSFSFKGDFDLRQNLPGQPMFDWVQSLGFWTGSVWAVWRWRRLAARQLLVWVAIMLLPSLLTDRAPQFERMIGFAPPGAALIAIGWVELWSRIGAWAGRMAAPSKLRQAPSTALAVGCLGASLAFNSYAYFAVYSRQVASLAAAAAAFTTTPVTLARELINRARSEPVYIERTPEVDDVFAFEYLFPGTLVRRLDFRQCLPLTDRRSIRTNYLVLAAQDHFSASTLLEAYPSAVVTRIHPEAAALMGESLLVEVPAGARAPLPAQRVSARFEPGIELLGYEWSGAKIQAGKSVFLTLFWKAQADITADLTAFVHVGMGSADSPIIAQHDGQPCQGLYPTSFWRAGDVIPDSFAITLPAAAPLGTYPLVTGWYNYPSLDRSPLLSADMPLSDNTAVVASLMLVAR